MQELQHIGSIKDLRSKNYKVQTLQSLLVNVCSQGVVSVRLQVGELSFFPSKGSLKFN